MEDLSNKLHLINRDGVWYYRRRVPKDLASRIGKKQIQHSLKTKDLNEAIARREKEDVLTTALFEAAKNDEPLTLTPTLALRLVQEYVEHQDRLWEKRSAASPPKDEAEKLDMKIDISMSEQILTDRDDPRSEENISMAMRKILRQSNYTLSYEDISRDELHEMVRRALIELYRRADRRIENDYSTPFIDHMFSPAAKVRMTFCELYNEFFEQYADDARGKKVSQKRINKVETQLRLIREIIGDDTPVQAIDYDRCMDFRRTLARIPSNRSKIYKNKPLDEVLILAEAAEKPCLAYETQADYLRTLGMVLNLAFLKRIIPNVPSSGMIPSAKKTSADKKRIPFELDQIRDFFKSKYYQKCAKGNNAPYKVETQHWRFWLPLICLFMGMRPKEVCQLELSDVQCTKNGVYNLRVSETDDEYEASKNSTIKKTIKTPTSKRKVPVHPELLKIGFTKFVEDQKKAGEQVLFNELKPDQYGDRAQYALKRFRETYLKQSIKIQELQSFYSFRHSFRDALRRIEAPPEVLQFLGGWSQGSLVSNIYGDKSDPDYLNTYVQRIEYPGLDLSHLYLKEDD